MNLKIGASKASARVSHKTSSPACIPTHDPGLPEAAHPAGSLLHGLLILLGQVEQSVFDGLCGNSSKPKVTERGQSRPLGSVHLQNRVWVPRRLINPRL